MAKEQTVTIPTSEIFEMWEIVQSALYPKVIFRLGRDRKADDLDMCRQAHHRIQCCLERLDGKLSPLLEE